MSSHSTNSNNCNNAEEFVSKRKRSSQSDDNTNPLKLEDRLRYKRSHCKKHSVDSNSSDFTNIQDGHTIRRKSKRSSVDLGNQIDHCKDWYQERPHRIKRRDLKNSFSSDLESFLSWGCCILIIFLVVAIVQNKTIVTFLLWIFVLYSCYSFLFAILTKL